MPGNQTVPMDSVQPPVRITALLEDVLGCKWSWSVLRAIYGGVTRPGQLERAIPGISTKVLNERLRKLVAHGVLEKIQYPELPPHVEYRFTALGTRLFCLLQQVEALEREFAAGTQHAGSDREQQGLKQSFRG